MTSCRVQDAVRPQRGPVRGRTIRASHRMDHLEFRTVGVQTKERALIVRPAKDSRSIEFAVVIDKEIIHQVVAIFAFEVMKDSEVRPVGLDCVYGSPSSREGGSVERATWSLHDARKGLPSSIWIEG